MLYLFARHKPFISRTALPQMPFPGLFHYGPPMARLRKLRTACICHRQRRRAIPKKDDQSMSPLDSSPKREA